MNETSLNKLRIHTALFCRELSARAFSTSLLWWTMNRKLSIDEVLCHYDFEYDPQEQL